MSPLFYQRRYDSLKFLCVTDSIPGKKQLVSGMQHIPACKDKEKNIAYDRPWFAMGLGKAHKLPECVGKNEKK